MRKDDEHLAQCPCCGGPPRDGLGLRNYEWVFDALPGRVGPSDLDFVLHDASTRRFLVLEFKPTRWVPRGQAKMFYDLARIGDGPDQDGYGAVASFDIWVVANTKEVGVYQVGVWNGDRVSVWRTVDKDTLKKMVGSWWNLES